MGNLGGGEILIILVVALVVLGPSRLPTAARQVGQAIGELKRISSGFQNEMKAAMDDVSLESSATSETDPETTAAADDEADRRERSRRLVTGSAAGAAATVGTDGDEDLGVRNGFDPAAADAPNVADLADTTADQADTTADQADTTDDPDELAPDAVDGDL
ncbi:MAG: Sec-independent protein translocase protein TatB [Acidimicrobiales bacterium]